MTLNNYKEISAYIKYADCLNKEFIKTDNKRYVDKLYAVFKTLQIRQKNYYVIELQKCVDLITIVRLLFDVGANDITGDEKVEISNLITKIEADCDTCLLIECEKENLNYNEVIAEINSHIEFLLLSDNFDISLN